MQCPMLRIMGLFLTALLTMGVVVWLTTDQTQAVGFHQDSPISPVDQPTATETSVVDIPTSVPAETATEIPVETPLLPTPELPVEVPTETPTDLPTEVPTDTPTPEPTATPLPPPTETPTATPTVRAVVLPTSTPEPTLFSVGGQVVDAALTSAVWIWLTCGSLVFFAVAGAIAGFSFYRQSRQRFDLYEVVPEEEPQPPGAGKRSRGPQASDEDSWPSSLP